jgi:Ca2+-binding RTX toxin-like protein
MTSTLDRNGGQLFMIVGDSVETVDIEAGSGDALLLINPPIDPDVITFDGDGGNNQIVVQGTAGDDMITVGPLGGSGGARNPIEVTGLDCVHLFGDTGDDELVNNTGINSIIDAGQGNDILVGGTGNDVLFGGAGIDALFGRAGDDFLFSDENIQGMQFADDGEILDGGLGLGDAADQQGDDFLRGIELLEDGGGQKTVLMFLRVVIGNVDADDAFAFTGCFPFLMPTVAAGDLGSVTQTMVNNVPVAGEVAFTFDPMFQPGFLTVTANYNQGATSPTNPLRVYLVDERGIGVGASTAEDGMDRIDVALPTPDMQDGDELREYTVIIYGANPDVDLTITNALTQNSPLTIHGTEGDDVVSLTTGSESMQIVYNGVPYEFSNSSTESVTFLGNGGVDSFTVDGIASTAFEVHGAGSTTLTGSPTVIHTAGVEVINYLLNGSAENYYSTELETYSWRNEANPMDVDASGLVTITDALLIVSELRRTGVRDIAHTDRQEAFTYFDTNGDGMLTLTDAILVVSELRSLIGAEAEASAASSPQTADDSTSAESALAPEGEAAAASSYEALLAAQADDEEDEDLFSANPVDELALDSIADDIAAAWDN